MDMSRDQLQGMLRLFRAMGFIRVEAGSDPRVECVGGEWVVVGDIDRQAVTKTLSQLGLANRLNALQARQRERGRREPAASHAVG